MNSLEAAPKKRNRFEGYKLFDVWASIQGDSLKAIDRSEWQALEDSGKL